MYALATVIKERLDELTDVYDLRLQEHRSYAAMPAQARRQAAHTMLSLLLRWLETDDASGFAQFLQARLQERAQQGFEADAVLHSINALESILVPLITDADSARFIWEPLIQARSLAYRRTTEILRGSEQMLRLIVDNLPQGIFWKDKNLVFQGCNRAFATRKNMASPDQVVGKTDLDLSPREMAERYRADDRQVMETGVSKLNYEEPQIAPDGEQRWLETSKVPLRDAGGTTVGVLCMYGDITERKQAEAERERLIERRAQQAQVSAQVSQELAGVPQVEELFRRIVTLVKESLGYYYAQILRYDPGRDVVALVAGYGEAGRSMLASGHSLPMGRGVVGTTAATGESVLASDVTGSPDWRPNPDLPDTQGELAVPIKLRDQVLGVLDVQSDRAGALTDDDRILLESLSGPIAVAMESTRLIEQTQRSEQLMRTLIDTLPENIYAKDTEGCFTLVNAAQAQLMGASTPQDLIGKSDLDFYPRELAEQYMASEQPILRDGVPLVNHEEPNVDAQGRTFWSSTTKVPVRNQQGQIVGLVGITRDITERKRAEAEMAERLRELNALYRTVSREGWETFRRAAALPGGYLFDGVTAQQADDLWLPQLAEAAKRGELVSEGAVAVAPLVVPGGEVVGTLGVYDDPQNPLSQEQRALLEEIADEIARALESARLSEMTQSALTETRALYQLGEVVGREQDLQVVYETVARTMVEQLGYASSWVAVLDREAQVLQGMVGMGTGAESGRRAIPLTRERDPAVAAIRERKSLIINDPLHSPLLAGMPSETIRELGKAAVVPLMVGEEAQGVITVSRPLEGANIAEQDARLLEAVASQVAVAIQRSHLFEQTRTALADAEATHRRYLRETWDAFLSGREETLEGYIARADSLAPVEDFWTPEMERAVLQGGPAVPARSSGEEKEQPQASMALPLQVRGQTIGVIDIAREGEEGWNQDEQHLIEALAQQLGDIIESERLFEQSRATLAETERLYEASQRITRAETSEQVLQVILDVAASTQVDQTVVVTFDNPLLGGISGQERIEMFWSRDGSPSSWPVGTSRPVDQDPFFGLLTSGDVLAFSDILSDNRAQGVFKVAAEGMGIRALALIPLSVGEEWLGYVMAASKTPHVFTSEELRVYRAVADQSSVVLRGLRLRLDAERRARREQLIREITTRMRAHADMDSILSTAVRELGQALGVSRTFIRLTTESSTDQGRSESD